MRWSDFQVWQVWPVRPVWLRWLARFACALLGLAACVGCGARKGPGDAAPACTGDPLSVMGVATHYSADGTGSCSFDPSPDDLMVAALSGADYDRAAWCGACLAVSGPTGEVVVRVVDKCPGCKHGDLDLSREAFAGIAPLSAGRVRIAWRAVPCPVTGSVSYQLKARSNAHWIAIQVRDHRYAIASLEARRDDGAYQALTRADYNYFVAAGGLGPGPFALRVTDVHGQIIEDDGIILGAAVSRPGTGQFALCP